MRRSCQLIASVVVLAVGLLASSCSIETLRGYPGPERTEAEIATLQRDIFDSSKTTTRVWISDVDPIGKVDPGLLHGKGYPQATMLPGEHRIRGFLTLYTEWAFPIGLNASVELPPKEISYTAEAGRFYMLKAAFDPLFLKHWEDRAWAALKGQESRFDFRVDAEVITLPTGEKGTIATILPDYYRFWIEEKGTGRVIAGSRPTTPQ